MKAVWVFNDFGKNINQRDLLMLLASVSLWSIHCPEDKRVLYCSDKTGNTMSSLGVLDRFDDVILLPKNSRFQVNSSVFWSYPKLEVLLEQQEPLFLIDHDFLVLEDIRREVLEGREVCYTFTEDAKEYYPSNLDNRIRNLSYKTKWPSESANVSFLFLPDPEWTRFYAGTSLQIMEELTAQQAPTSKYLIFAEQMVLKHLLFQFSSYRCLVQNIYECRSEAWTNNYDEHGLWKLEDCWGKKFIHYGPVKKSWKKVEYDNQLREICDLAGISQEMIKKTDYLRR